MEITKLVPLDYVEDVFNDEICKDCGSKLVTRTLGGKFTRTLCIQCTEGNIAERTEGKIKKGKDYKNYAKVGGYFKKYSICSNRSVLNKTIDMLKKDSNQSEKVSSCRSFGGLIMKQKGKAGKLLLTGGTGVGKTHLAVSILNGINNHNKYTCMFVEINELLSRIRASYNDKNLPTENDYLKAINTADIVVLDDLGAENGKIQATESSDFATKILFSILNSREDKTTIVTTNLNEKQLQVVYDKRLVSRLFHNCLVVDFNNCKDFRKK